MEFSHHTLPNGLEIVAECNDQVHSASVGFFVKTGARDEWDDVAGVSHFLEHMVFKGTPQRSADDVNREFDELGAHYNAFTSEETTVYYAAMLPECIDRTLALWADVLRPSLREEDFQTEKQVILEEIAMYEDQPPFGADEKCRAAYFGHHPLGRSILGSVKSIEALSGEAMLDYFQRRYSPGNIALVATGKIDFDQLVETANRCCGDWSPSETTRHEPPAKPQGGTHVLVRPTATQQYILQLAAAPDAASPDRYAAKLAAAVIGDDTGSRFYWDLIDPGRVDSASLSHQEYDGAGVFWTYMSCDPALAAENLALVERIYRQMEADGITDDELDQVKSKVRSRIVLSGEKPRGRLFAVGSDWIQRAEYLSIRDDLDAIASLTRADLEAVLAAHPLTQATTLSIGPLETL